MAVIGLAFSAADRAAQGATVADLIRSLPWLWLLAGVALWSLVRRVGSAPLPPELEAAIAKASATAYSPLFCNRCSSPVVANELLCPSCRAIQWRETREPIIFVVLVSAFIGWILVRQR